MSPYGCCFAVIPTMRGSSFSMIPADLLCTQPLEVIIYDFNTEGGPFHRKARKVHEVQGWEDKGQAYSSQAFLSRGFEQEPHPIRHPPSIKSSPLIMLQNSRDLIIALCCSFINL